MSKKKTMGLCPICGEERLLTKDHLPPRQIFLPPRPNDLITILTCHDCNNGSSKNDEVFKVVLAMMLVGDGIPVQPLFDNAMRSLKHNKRIRRAFTDNMKDAYLTSPDGIIIDKGVVVQLVPEMAFPFVEVVKRITKGLYYYHLKRFIGYDTKLKVRLFKQFTKEMHEIVKFGIIRKIGSGQFSYCYANAVLEGYETSMWLYEFHKKYWVSCVTKAPINHP